MRVCLGGKNVCVFGGEECVCCVENACVEVSLYKKAYLSLHTHTQHPICMLILQYTTPHTIQHKTHHTTQNTPHTTQHTLSCSICTSLNAAPSALDMAVLCSRSVTTNATAPTLPPPFFTCAVLGRECVCVCVWFSCVYVFGVCMVGVRVCFRVYISAYGWFCVCIVGVCVYKMNMYACMTVCWWWCAMQVLYIHLYMPTHLHTTPLQHTPVVIMR